MYHVYPESNPQINIYPSLQHSSLLSWLHCFNHIPRKMPNFKCYPIADPDTIWLYCPSYNAAIVFTVLFGLTTCVHSIQAYIYRKPFAIVLIMGTVWETAGYAMRILSVREQLNSGIFTSQQLLILLAPLWINAFVYMVLGRMIHFYLEPDRVLGIKARSVTTMFVCFDVTAFLVQACGGMLTNSDNPVKTQKIGINTYMGGVGLQLFFILIFIILAVNFHLQIRRNNARSTTDQVSLTAYSRLSEIETSPDRSALLNSNNRKLALHLLYVVYLVLGVIIFRNIYRLIEFSIGIESAITKHEWYSYVFDAIPMFFALLAFNIYHPGRVLQGPRSDFGQENKRLNQEKKAKKLAEKQTKVDEKALKKSKKAQKKMWV